jgi:ABC-2 type transport system ATP-binding protein
MSAIVRARGLNKSFGTTRAMDNVSFTIEKGSIVGLLGPNGAGKTTTLKAILGLTAFDGELEVVGMDPRHGRHHLMEKVCFIADVGVLPRWMKVSQALDYVAGVHPRFNRQKAEAMLSQTSIGRHSRVGQLSKGMVTQLHLSLILAIDVELLVLDEPTLGLDILYQKTFFDLLLNDYYDKDTSIIISTHQVEEVRALLTHVMIIDAGRIVLDSGMDELSSRFTEVLVNPDQIEQARQLKPIRNRTLLGRQAMLFDGVDKSQLAELGELHDPGLSDLFVACVEGNRGAGHA